ncbi:nucleotide exchange factor GrpE [candidate division WOR-3 bacterium]|nr:nucleotide exchange factor GrpE [candidate division WOR-3 bacterium]
MIKKGPVTRLKETLEEKETEVKELHNKYLRALADLDNYRKLMQKEMVGYRKSSKLEFFNKIIPVLDSFDRAMEGDHDNAEKESFIKGIEIIHRQFREALNMLGLKEFSGLGEVFDPSRHEAVATVETDEHPEHMVIEEISKGYMVDNQVVKAAKVCVSTLKKGGQDNAEDNRD